MSDLTPRLVSALVMMSLALAALWAGGRVFAIFWLIACSAVLWEWLSMSCRESRLAPVAAGASALAVVAALAGGAAADFAIAIAATGALALALMERARRPAWAAAGLVYAAAMLISVIVLRGSLLFGWQVILWLFAVVWGTDICAYFGGRLIGGAKLWPAISPSKAWSGFLVGIAGGALAGTCVLAFSLPSGRQSLIVFAAMGLLTAAISQGGDLLESAIKRHFNAKDSSHLIPGHGGAMDRLDGFAAACVFAALIGVIRGGLVNPATGLFVW